MYVSDEKMGQERWNCNSFVTVFSSAYNWNQEQDSVERYDKSTKECIQAPCPSSVLE